MSSEQKYDNTARMEKLRARQAELVKLASGEPTAANIRALSMINHRIHVERARQRGQWERTPIENMRILK